MRQKNKTGEVRRDMGMMDWTSCWIMVLLVFLMLLPDFAMMGIFFSKRRLFQELENSLINSSMSTRTKIGLGFKEYFGEDEAVGDACSSLPPSLETYMPPHFNPQLFRLRRSYASCDFSLMTKDQILPPAWLISDLPESDVEDPNSTAGSPSFSCLENVKSPRIFCNKSGMNNRNVCKNNSVRQHLFLGLVRNSSASVTAGEFDPAARRNRSAVNSAGRPNPTGRVGQAAHLAAAQSNPAGWSKRPAPVSAGRPVSAGWSKRPTPVSAGRPVSAGWHNPAARPYFRPSSVYFNNWPELYDPMYMNEGRWGTAVKTSAGYSWRNKRPHFWGSKSNGGSIIYMGNLSSDNDIGQGRHVNLGGGRDGLRAAAPLTCSCYHKFVIKRTSFFTDTDCLVLTEEFHYTDEVCGGYSGILGNVIFTPIRISELTTGTKCYLFSSKSNPWMNHQMARRMASCELQTSTSLAKEGCSITNPHNKTPYELISGKVPQIGHLKPFGCQVTILNTSDHLGKFEGKADEGIRYLVGYAPNSKAYRGIGHEWYFDLDYLTDSLGYTRFKTDTPAVLQGNPAVSTSVSADFIPVHADESTLPPGQSLGSSENNTRFPVPSDVCKDQLSSGIFTSSSYDDDFSATLTNLAPAVEILGDLASPVLTRSRAQKSKFGESAFIGYIQDQQRTNHTDQLHCLFACFLSQLEPTSIAKALEDPDWVAAMQEEMQQFINQKVWKLVPLPDGKNAIGTKWILKNKRDARGIVVRNKARLVAQGHRQEEGIDYDEVFAPVGQTEMRAIRLEIHYRWMSISGQKINFMAGRSRLLWLVLTEAEYVAFELLSCCCTETYGICKKPSLESEDNGILRLGITLERDANEKNLITGHEDFTQMIMWPITAKDLHGHDLSIWWIWCFVGYYFLVIAGSQYAALVVTFLTCDKWHSSAVWIHFYDREVFMLVCMVSADGLTIFAWLNTFMLMELVYAVEYTLFIVTCLCCLHLVSLCSVCIVGGWSLPLVSAYFDYFMLAIAAAGNDAAGGDDAANEDNAAVNEATGSAAEAHLVPHSPLVSPVRESTLERQPVFERPPSPSPTPPAQTFIFEEPLVFGPEPRPAGYVDPDDLDKYSFSMEDDTTHGGFHVESTLFRPDDDFPRPKQADAAVLGQRTLLLTNGLYAKLGQGFRGRIDSLETSWLRETRLVVEASAAKGDVDIQDDIDLDGLSRMASTALGHDQPAGPSEDVEEEKEEEEVPLRETSLNADLDYLLKFSCRGFMSQARNAFVEDTRTSDSGWFKRLRAEDLAQEVLPNVSEERAKELDDLMMRMTETDWLNLMLQVGSNPALARELLGADVNEENFIERMTAVKEKKKRALADLRYRALKGKPMKKSEVTQMMRNLVKNQWCAAHNGTITMKDVKAMNAQQLPAITEPPSKRQRVSSQPASVPAATTLPADDSDSAGGGSSNPAGSATPVALRSSASNLLVDLHGPMYLLIKYQFDVCLNPNQGVLMKFFLEIERKEQLDVQAGLRQALSVIATAPIAFAAQQMVFQLTHANNKKESGSPLRLALVCTQIRCWLPETGSCCYLDVAIHLFLLVHRVHCCFIDAAVLDVLRLSISA
ncbi:putative ribonuclease H-like domain-containing protein [Tanacetum coccineum]